MSAVINAKKEVESQDPRLYSEVRVRQSMLTSWFPWLLHRPHGGEPGIILGVGRVWYSRRKLYTVLFEKGGLYWMYSYSEEDLEFL